MKKLISQPPSGSGENRHSLTSARNGPEIRLTETSRAAGSRRTRVENVSRNTANSTEASASTLFDPSSASVGFQVRRLVTHGTNSG